MKRIIIIGASSGMGRELTRIYADAGNLVGATGRRQDLLYALQLAYPNNIITECFDVTATGSIGHLESMIHKMGGLDLLIYSAGYGKTSETLDAEIDKTTVDTNVTAFLEITGYAFRYFVKQGYGHLVTISSVSSVRGNSWAPAYSASKAFQSTYFEGLLMKLKKMKAGHVFVTDVQPGFVNTKMAGGNKRFWVASPAKAARQIADAIEKKKGRVYITHRWWLIARLMKWMPDFIYHRIG